jgi:hypothetical protein
MFVKMGLSDGASKVCERWCRSEVKVDGMERDSSELQWSETLRFLRCSSSMLVRGGRCTWCFLRRDVLAGNNMSHEAFGRSCARAWWDIDIVSALGGRDMARRTTERDNRDL